MSKDWRQIIASDEREFRYGEIYKVKDELVNFPEALFAPRTFHHVRLVVITQHCAANLDKNIWTVNAAPLSTRTDMKRDTDLEIEPCNGNYIKQKSLIRLGASQPFLKVDLEGPVGRLSPEQQKLLAALQLRLAGIM